MVLGNILSTLFSGPSGFMRPANQNPRKLLVRADRQAIEMQREFLLNKFGFDETITDKPERETLIAPKEKKGNNKRRTLL